MTVKLIGRKTDFCGKSLWEIIGNLKNFGIGRLVKRHMFERYEEPSFIKIIKVIPLQYPKQENPYQEMPRKVIVWAEKVFRGRKYPDLVEIYKTSYKADYVLIPKDDEQELLTTIENYKGQKKILPRTIPFPLLMKEFIIADMKKKNIPVTSELYLKLQINEGRDRNYRQAAENELPTHLFDKNNVFELTESTQEI